MNILKKWTAWTEHDLKLPTDDIGELGKYKMDEILLHLQLI